MTQNLTQQAIQILKDNDRGGFTIPTSRLYPYQWNWDSAFVALGFAKFDRDRAWRELELLIEGQWPNGMLPHILFRRHDPDYFPGADVWHTTHMDLPTSGHSQPPVLATVVHQLVEDGGKDDVARAAALFEPILRWHRWFFMERKCVKTGVIGTVHPWETGRDNCPDWTSGLVGMSVDPDIGPYKRKDIEHIDPSERPSKAQYDRYVSIIKFGRDHDWDQTVLTNHGPFLMADPGIHFILLRANRDLLKLAHILGLKQFAPEVQSWIDHGLATSDYMWNEKVGAFTARNLRTGEFSNGVSNASPLNFYADAGTPEQRRRSLKNVERIQKKVKYLMPSWDPDAEEFESQRYWCGPVWPQMNQILSMGFADSGHDDIAQDIRQDLASAIQQSNFYECFDPISGQGCVGEKFSWTAASWLAWASPEDPVFQKTSLAA